MKTTNLSLTVAAALVLALHGATAFAQQQTAAVQTADPYKKEAAPAQAAQPHDGEPKDPVQIAILEEAFSLPIADAFALLHEAPDDGERYRRLVKMTAEGKAKLERLITLRTKSGQRAVAESIDEVRYATEYGPARFQPPTETKAADAPAKPAATPHPVDPEMSRIIAASGPAPTTFETRNVGDTMEVEPVLGPAENYFIDLNIVPQGIRYLGEREIKGPNPVRQPLFESQKLTTSVTLKDGHPFLLGTLSPPWENGITQEQPQHRIWLDFMTCTVVSPTGEPALAPARAAVPPASKH